MKYPFYSDTRIPWNPSGGRRKRRCAEVDCLCADPAARRVTCGAASMMSACPGGFCSQLCR